MYKSNNQTMSNAGRKRVFHEIFEDCNSLQSEINAHDPSKKRKTCPTSIIDSDIGNIEPSKNHGIESICKILDKASLIHHLNIPTIINTEIAEFARGEVEYCCYRQCNQPICIVNKEATNTSDIMYKRRDSEPSISLALRMFYCITSDIGIHKYCVTEDGHCIRRSGIFCAQHRPPTCWRDQEFEEQPKISYERAVQILLNEGACINVYDFEYKRWRPAKYFCHWNSTNRVMLSYIDHRHEFEMSGTMNGDAWRCLSFPSVCILLSPSSVLKPHMCLELS
eukprot:48123_1